MAQPPAPFENSVSSIWQDGPRDAPVPQPSAQDTEPGAPLELKTKHVCWRELTSVERPQGNLPWVSMLGLCLGLFPDHTALLWASVSLPKNWLKKASSRYHGLPWWWSAWLRSFLFLLFIFPKKDYLEMKSRRKKKMTHRPIIQTEVLKCYFCLAFSSPNFFNHGKIHLT